MIDTLDWPELSGDPEKFLQALEEREAELQQELYKVRQVARQVRQLLKVKDTLASWHESGIPEQRQAENQAAGPEDAATGGTQPPTRKIRIMTLLSQDPQRQWKVSDVATALDEVPKIKSVRVAMDELAKVGSLTKLPNAFYKVAHSQQS
ncbi:hypothetical protein HUT19_19980 [Streptomyces sp. NA02950]|uniref:hypothetical protein n=1 Tax=Streptomyces sp. NA02950 TaxID=2742137 RepID=UPI00158FD3C8|nr:hypothetical protein [Streptomyces sp. NA02950]QKV93754.1 hypothetical protein HUT19_19980 [Streptomyces sp. NA02950]